MLGIIGVVTVAVGGVAGGTYYLKNRKLSFSERRSIQNIENVLRAFNRGELLMYQNKKRYGDGYYFYEKSNFIIQVEPFEQVTKVRLKDTELNNDQIFFFFEYRNQSKEILTIKEDSTHYIRHGHFERLQELLSSFVQSVMATDWNRLEETQQEELKQKYLMNENPKPTEATVDFKRFTATHPLVIPWVHRYLTNYQKIEHYKKRLPLEVVHHIERDHQYLETLCQSFEALGGIQQEQEWSILKKCLEEKNHQLEESLQMVQKDALFAFRRTAEIMHTDNRI